MVIAIKYSIGIFRKQYQFTICVQFCFTVNAFYAIVFKGLCNKFEELKRKITKYFFVKKMYFPSERLSQ